MRKVKNTAGNSRRRQAEKAMRASQAQLAAIIRSAMDAVITVNGRQRIVFCNQAAERMFGRPARHLLGQPLEVLIPKAARRAHVRHVRRFGATGVTNRQMGALGQVSGLRADGTEFPIEASISQVEQEGQKFFTVILRDITGRLRSEDALRREKEFSEGLVNTAPVIVLVLDLKGRIVRFNPYLTAITGHRLEDVQGQDWCATFLPVEDQERIRKMFARSMGGTRTHGNINPILTTTGRRRDIEWFDTQLKAADGSVTGLLAIGRDVTERLRAEETLRRSEADLSDFFVESPLGLLWVGADGRIQRVNRAQLELLGCEEDEVLGRPLAEFLSDPEVAADALDRLSKRETLNNHHALFRRKNGSSRHVLIDANGLWTQDQLVHSRWFVRDITRRLELQSELLQIAERERQRIGRDLHDGLGQQLHGLSYLAALLEKDLQHDASPRAEEVRQLNKHLGEALELTRAIAHGLQPVKPVPEGLALALREFAARMRGVYRLDCRFECRAPVLIHRQSAATHLYRIAQEAVNNAIKHGKATRILIQLGASPERIILGIRDNGVGIRQRAENSKGMGLRIMQYRAETVGGSLVVQKLPQRGTEVVCTVRRPALLSAGNETP